MKSVFSIVAVKALFVANVILTVGIFVSDSAVAAGGVTASAPAVTDLVHRWSFNGDLTDSAGGQTAKVVGSVTSDGKQYILPGGDYGSSYIDLGSDVLPKSSKSVTMEIWATQISVKNYSRIFAFGGSGGNLYMEWTQSTYISVDELWFGGLNFVYVNGVNGILAPYTLGTEFHISVVMTEGKDGVWTAKYYKKSAQTGETLKTFAAVGSDTWSLKNQNLTKCYLGQAVNGSTEKTANASYNEVRIWNRAMTEDELTASAKAGPDGLHTITFVDPTGHYATRKEIVIGGSYKLAWMEGGMGWTRPDGYYLDQNKSWKDAQGNFYANGATISVSSDITLSANYIRQVSVTGVTAQQRYPWCGLVDVTVTMKGNADDVADVECLFAATNSANKMVVPVAHITRNGEDVGSGNVWTRKFVWDAKDDVGAVKIDDVALNVTAELSYVQLWDNGPCWAKSNVGAVRPDDSGYYFWWGDAAGYKRNDSNDGWISVKDSDVYSFGDCPTYDKGDLQLQLDGYIDATGNLVHGHDAAAEYLGSAWRMPTGAEVSELVSNCKATWTTRNGVNGCMIVGKGAYSSASIFLPAAGNGFATRLNDFGTNGFYWASTPTSGSAVNAKDLFFTSGKFYASDNNRRNGRSVRPVRDFDTSCFVTGRVTARLALDCRSNDPIPELSPSASSDEVRAALEGSADAKLQENITDAETYGQYREWAMNLGAESVKGAEYSWISFAIDSGSLLARALADGDLKIVEFDQTSPELNFSLAVNVAGVTVGPDATDANLKKTFWLGGTARLGVEEFAPDKVAYEFIQSFDGKLRLTASPKDKVAESFFLRMMVK